MKKEDRKPPRSATGAPTEGPSFEDAMKRLNEIVEALESGELPLDESLRLFEEGVSLSRRAGDLLGQAERKIEILTKTTGGALEAEPFEEGDLDDRD